MDKTPAEELRSSLSNLAYDLEFGGITSITIGVMTSDGTAEHTIDVTGKGRQGVLLLLKEMLGRVR